MSNVQNDVWLEDAHTNFEQAVEEGNLGLAKAIIADCRDAGFKDQAAIMDAECDRKFQPEVDMSKLEDVLDFMRKLNEKLSSFNPYKPSTNTGMREIEPGVWIR